MHKFSTLLAGATLLCGGPAAAATFSIIAFGNNIEAAVSPVTVGWSYSIARDGKIIEFKGGGAARTKVDGFRAHGPTVRQNVASVSKLVTAVATMQLLAKLKLSEKTSISAYLPKAWAQGPNIADVTFSDLLRHRSGIVAGDMNSVAILGYDGMKALVAKGTSPRPGPDEERKWDYDNANFALLRVTIPYLWAKTGADPYAEALALKGVPALVKGSAQAAKDWNAYAYVAYVQQKVFAPMGVKNALCADRSSTATLYYAPGGAFPGNKSFADNDWTLACGSGGWYLSSNDLTALVTWVRMTETLVPKEWRDRMFDRGYGWDNIFNTTGGTGRSKNGVVGAGGNPKSGLRACVMALPGAIEASLVENSGTTLPLDVCAVLKKAYEDAWK